MGIVKFTIEPSRTRKKMLHFLKLYNMKWKKLKVFLVVCHLNSTPPSLLPLFVLTYMHVRVCRKLSHVQTNNNIQEHSYTHFPSCIFITIKSMVYHFGRYLCVYIYIICLVFFAIIVTATSSFIERTYTGSVDRLYTFYAIRRRHSDEWHNLSLPTIMRYLRGTDKNSQLNLAISRIIWQ